MDVNMMCVSQFYLCDRIKDLITWHLNDDIEQYLALFPQREQYHIHKIVDPPNLLEAYNDMVFFQLFRMKKETFTKLLAILHEADERGLLEKVHRGGNYPLKADKALLIFLWYILKQDTLNSIADRFRIVPSTVMKVVNSLLYLVCNLKRKYICFPTTIEEYEHIKQDFTSYPDTIGAVDGTHIKLKVPVNQQDSYIDRYLSHSINLMAICTVNKLFTYIFVGYPGSAHDSRAKIFSKNSHIIGDSAFPLKTWLMTPYKNPQNAIQRHHNFCLSQSRVCIENSFGILKGRWRRLRYINTYSICKAIEIVTAACILHNFCYKNGDEWLEEHKLYSTA